MHTFSLSLIFQAKVSRSQGLKVSPSQRILLLLLPKFTLIAVLVLHLIEIYKQ